MYAHDYRCPTNPFKPQYVGFCERCGFKVYYDALRWQWDWRGNALMNLQILVHPQCEDKPFENNRPVIIGPDSVPPSPRPTPPFYGQQMAGAGLTAPPTIQNHPLTRPPTLQPPPSPQREVIRDDDFR